MFVCSAQDVMKKPADLLEHERELRRVSTDTGRQRHQSSGVLTSEATRTHCDAHPVFATV